MQAKLMGFCGLEQFAQILKQLDRTFKKIHFSTHLNEEWNEGQVIEWESEVGRAESVGLLKESGGRDAEAEENTAADDDDIFRRWTEKLPQCSPLLKFSPFLSVFFFLFFIIIFPFLRSAFDVVSQRGLSGPRPHQWYCLEDNPFREKK